jgi:DNA-directed RNA polymerase subunit beta'
VAKIPRVVGKTSDITGGLPRVTELFEARNPSNPAVVSEIDGVVTYGGIKRGNREVTIQSKEGISKKYLISLSKHILVQDGDFVRAGTPLSDGSITPQDILSIEGISAVQNYIVNGIQEVYRLQGVKINDKHIEVIIKQMMQKVAVIESGDTMFLEGSAVDKIKFKEQNDMLYDKRVVTDPGDSNEVKAGEILTLRKLRDLNSSLKRKDMKVIEVREALTATSGPLLQGITKASLGTYSFMSAASFQETTKVLNEAAIAGKVDEMLGLKENVIVGHLIPAGTGLRSYEDLVVGSQDEYDMLKAAKEDVSEEESAEVAE